MLFMGDNVKLTLKFWKIFGFVFSSVSGVLLHFLFDWTKGSILVAPFSGVNESIWEHMKLLFFPLLIFAFTQNKFIGNNYKSFWWIKLVGIMSGLLIIPTLYYLYTGVFGVNADWFNIIIFFIAAFFAFCIEQLLFKSQFLIYKSDKIALILLIIIALLFIIFTFIQPKIPLFMDMSTGKYGI